MRQRGGPSLGDVLSEREVVEIHVKPIRHPIRRHTHLADGRSADLRFDKVLANGGDHLDDEDRERLHGCLKESIRQMKAGRTTDADS
jgi:hypothetical protein